MTSAEYQAGLALLDAGIAADIQQRHAAPGLAIAVVQGDTPVWARGFGLADIAAGTKVAADTVFAIGSITKLFTATMLMQLRDAGKLRLDDPVQQILPEVQVPHHHPGAPPITLRHLVTHTSGLAKDGPLPYWDHGQTIPPVERLMELLAETEQPYPPGMQWKYSNLAIALLGYALQRIAGQSWDSWIAERILAPLGMDGAAPRLAGARGARLATGYGRPGNWPPDIMPHQDLAGIAAGGSIHASVTDMAKFLAQQWAPAPTVLGAASIAEMHRPIWLNEDWQSGQGIGWRVLRAADGTTRIGHGGGVHGFTCAAMASVKDRLGVAVFTNGTDGTVGQGIAIRALDLLTPILRREAAQAREKPRGPADWARYAGRYGWFLGEAEILFRDGTLSLRLPIATGWEEVALTPDGEHFRMHGGQVHGETLRFVADPDGIVRRAWLGPHPYERLDG